MNRSARKLLTIVIMRGATLLVAGCGQPVEFDPATQYTPEALAQELIFRVKTLKRSSKSTPKNAQAKIASRLPEKKGKAAGSEATKREIATTIGDVVEETVEKFSLIKKTSSSETRKIVAGVVSKDKSLGEEDRKEILGELEPAAGSPTKESR
ncbi:hypothetical protein ACYOEI_04105 [Singulisphaera rosea]